MQKPLTILIALFVLVIIGYYFWTWPLYMLRYGISEGTTQYKECFSTRGRSMPVEFSYPPNGTENVSTRSLVVIKLKEGNEHTISSMNVSYRDGTSSSPATSSSASAKYFIAGNYFPEEAFKIDPDFPDRLPGIDIMGRTQEFESLVQAAESNAQKLALIHTEGTWKPNQALTVEIRAACYNPYQLEFRTGKE
jgi:hypothetical protein